MRIVIVIVAALAALAVVAIGFGVWLHGTLNELGHEAITDDVHMITGVGGNVGVLRTAAGAVVVDSMTFAMQGERIRALAEDLGGGPVQVLLNTHYHTDHAHGNPGFEPSTRFVSTRRTLEHLRFFDAAYWEGDAAATMPEDTFEEFYERKIGGKTVRAHHLGRGHTDGDLVVLFVEDRVLHTGDLVFNRRYPNIDLEAGGSVREWSATLDRILALDFDYVIPGHGPATDEEGIREFQRFILDLWEVGEQAAREGTPLEEHLRDAPLRADEGFEDLGVPLIFRLDRPFVLQRVWEEANGVVEPQNPPKP